MYEPLILPFLISFLVSTALTPLAGWFARRVGRVSPPSPSVDGHTRATPCLGGLALFVGVAPFLPFSKEPGLVWCAIPMALLGLVDDFVLLSPGRKLIAQAGVGIVAVWAGLRFDFAVGVGLSAGLTVLWLVVTANAVNVLDMMNGLAGGVGAVASLGFAAALVSLGRGDLATTAVATTGGLIGFLIHNFHPARIFMGNVGSLLTASLLAGMAVIIQRTGGGLAGLLFLGVPLFEAVFLVFVRTRNGRKWYLASRDHTAQRLVQAGCSIREAVAILYAATLLCVVVGTLVVRSGRAGTFLAVVGLAAGGMVAGWRLGRIDMGPGTRDAGTAKEPGGGPQTVRT